MGLLVCAVFVSFVLCVVYFHFFVFSPPPNKGQTLTIPLSLTLDHWKEVQEWATNQSVKVKKKKWQIFCTSEWPTFNVGWPRDGTFNINVILKIKEQVFNPEPHGHPDQVP